MHWYKKSFMPMTTNSNGIGISIQIASQHALQPNPDFVKKILYRAQQQLGAARRCEDHEITVRCVDEVEMQGLNLQFRQKHKSTNVLAFPTETPPGMPIESLGDIVLCIPIIAHEAKLANIEFEVRCAHMLIHAYLHLQGYDHQNDAEQAVMEAHESRLMRNQGFPDPYSPH